MTDKNEVNDLLRGSYNQEGIDAWWRRSRQALDRLTPEQAWAQGRTAEVLALAREVLR